MKVLIANDHAAFDLKQRLLKELPQVEWIDCGTSSLDRVDYPDFADKLVQQLLANRRADLHADDQHGVDRRVDHAVHANEKIFGVLLCGSGQGMALRANRHPQVRAAVVWSEESARLSRAHNDCNIICLGARLIDNELCARLIEVFLTTPFEGGRHADRLQKIDAALPASTHSKSGSTP